MARGMKQGAALDMAHANFPSFLRSRRQAIILDKWTRGEQYQLPDSDEVDVDTDHVAYGRPYSPGHNNGTTTDEYDNLASLSPGAWGGLVVASLAQTAYVDGVRRPNVKGNLSSWATWQANRWDSKQTAIHRTAIGLSTAYGTVMPGRDPLTGAKRAKMQAYSPEEFAAFYDNDDDEWPVIGILARPYRDALGVDIGWNVTVFDEYVNHRMSCTGDGLERSSWTYIDFEEHGIPVPPVARCVNRIDLKGRATGEIEPVLPLLRRIDQDSFDRLIVQRFGAWKVRYIAGMAKPSKAQEAQVQAMKLRIEDLLISANPETRFGTLDATDLKGFIEASDADLRMLAAITQTPPHHLLGLSSNLQAEALAAAESGLQRKSNDFRMNAGEFHEQMFRLTAMVDGDMETAAATDMQVRWRDTESRSLTQAADALGKLAVQLQVPVEMLWEKVPGFTDSDVERAKQLVESGGFDQLIRELMSDDQGAPDGPQAA